MGSELKKTLLGLVVLSILAIAIGLLLFRTYLSAYYFGLFPFLVLVFLLMNGLFFYFFYRSMQKTDTQFIRFFMASSGIKIMVYLVMLLTYVLIVPEHAIPFTVTLLLLYLLFTFYDLSVMFRALKRKKEKNPDTV